MGFPKVRGLLGLIFLNFKGSDVLGTVAVQGTCHGMQR